MPRMDPSTDIRPITKNDSTVFPVTRAFSVAVGGDVKLRTADGNTVTVTLPAGVFPVGIDMIWSAGTTASGFAAIY